MKETQEPRRSAARMIASYTDYDNRTIEIRERLLERPDGAREVLIEQWLEEEFDRIIARHVLDLP